MKTVFIMFDDKDYEKLRDLKESKKLTWRNLVLTFIKG